MISYIIVIRIILIIMIKYIQAKTILSRLKDAPDPYFGITYNMNLYRGCQHQCIYCDSRSLCYNIDNLADIMIKENAGELLKKELKSKRKKATIGTGSMNDPYMPVEKKAGLTRKAMEIIAEYKFPVHILTKSDLVLRDTDIIKDISRTYAAASFTITSESDSLAARTEPGAPAPSARFKAMKQLAANGIYTGLILTPVLPFITDSTENIEEIIARAGGSGAEYILFWPGMTQREGQREYYYNKLDKLFPGIKEKYINAFANKYNCNSPNAKRLYELYEKLCSKYSISTGMIFYKEDEQLAMF